MTVGRCVTWVVRLPSDECTNWCLTTWGLNLDLYWLKIFLLVKRPSKNTGHYVFFDGQSIGPWPVLSGRTPVRRVPADAGPQGQCPCRRRRRRTLTLLRRCRRQCRHVFLWLRIPGRQIHTGRGLPLDPGSTRRTSRIDGQNRRRNSHANVTRVFYFKIERRTLF